MLAKLNQYRQTLNFPLVKSKNTSTQFRFEWVEDLKQLREVQAFRAAQFSEQFSIKFAQDIDQGLYDFGCEHAVLREKWTGEIVAYTRLKLFQGHELSQSYSAQEFEIVDQLAHLKNIVEIGRTCVHPQFRSGKALSMLWLHLLPKLLWGMQAKSAIGCVSIGLENNLARTYYTQQKIQALPAHLSIDVVSKSRYEFKRPTHNFIQDERLPKLFDAYINMQAQFSKQPYYDADFNCLDYFVFLEANKIAKNYLLNRTISR